MNNELLKIVLANLKEYTAALDEANTKGKELIELLKVQITNNE